MILFSFDLQNQAHNLVISYGLSTVLLSLLSTIGVELDFKCRGMFFFRTRLLVG